MASPRGIPAYAGMTVEGAAAALLPGAPDGFLTGGCPGAALPGLVIKLGWGDFFDIPVKPAQSFPAIDAGAGEITVSRAESGAAGDILGPSRPASVGRRRFRPCLPEIRAGKGSPGKLPATNRPAAAILVVSPTNLGNPYHGCFRTRATGRRSPAGANQAAGLWIAGLPGIRIRASIRGQVAAADSNPLDPLNPPLFLPGKLKNAVDADPGNAGLALGQPALLGGDKAAELAALAEIDGVIPLVTVFAGGPGFSFGESVGLVDAAVKGLAPVFGQGLEDGRSAVGVGKDLPVGTIPGDRPALRRGCPPPPLRSLKGIGQGRLLLCVGTWLFLPDGVRGLGLLISINPVAG